jgi:DNA processing protein
MMNLSNSEILLHLSLIQGVGPATVQPLLSISNLALIYDFSVQDFMRVGRLSERVSRILLQGLAKRDDLYRELDLLKNNNIAWISQLDQEYPEYLKHIHIPPIGFYSKGDSSVLAAYPIAIVGSRAAGVYAQRVLDLIVPGLVQAGCLIVSGGAYGVDTMAHQAAHRYGGKTVAVLGSGLLRIYPRENKQLFEKIAEHQGALISTFRLEQEPLQGNFPARNRVISGISRACIVVQAGAKSGALITAQHALEQGKEVFAVPGLITDPLSEGCNELLRQGAAMARSAEDILESLKINISYTPEKNMAVPFLQENKPSSSEQSILSLCQHPTSLDELVNHTGFSLHAVQELVFDLHAQKKITQDFTGLWVSC